MFGMAAFCAVISSPVPNTHGMLPRLMRAQLNRNGVRLPARPTSTQGVEVVWNGVVIDTIAPTSSTWTTRTFEVLGTGGLQGRQVIVGDKLRPAAVAGHRFGKPPDVDHSSPRS